MTPENLSIIASIVSIIVAVLAIWLSVTFYRSGRDSEKQVSVSLSEIKTQAGSLQKLSGKWMTQLIEHVTEPKPSSTDEALPHIIKAFAEIPQVIQASFQEKQTNESKPITESQLCELYVALYFYIAQTNYWSQFYLPTNIDEFSPDTNEWHSLYKNIVDMSALDFKSMSKILDNCDQKLLKETLNNHLLTETDSYWAKQVTDTTNYFVRNK